MTNAEVKAKMEELRETFAHGKYWNHDPSQTSYSLNAVREEACNHAIYGTAGCNFYPYGTTSYGQCYAFALYMAERIFGAAPTIHTYYPGNGQDFGNGWRAYSGSFMSGLTLEPGDVIRVGPNDNTGHSAIVYDVTDGEVTVAEVWGSIGCQIAWGPFNNGAIPDEETLLEVAAYIIKAPSAITVTLNANGGTCSMATKEVYYGSTYGTLPVPTRTGHTFMGWWDTSTNTECISTTTVTKSTAHTLMAIWGKTYKLTNVASGKCLNINGDNLTSLTPWTNVTLWSDSGSNEQKWILSTDYDSKPIKSVIDRNYGLNIYLDSTYNCNVYQVAGNETDSAVYFTNYGSYYRVGLHNYNRYLTAAGTGDGANVYWATYTESNLQKWVLTEI